MIGALLVALATAAPGEAQPVAVKEDSAIERALAGELFRAKTDLKEEGYPAAYYASLTAVDVDSWERRCLFGGQSFAGRFSQRIVTPDVRVGDYSLDNHPLTTPTGFVGQFVPRDDDEFALRHSLWRLLDGSFKSASAEFLRKQAQRVSRGKADYDTDDLTKEKPRLSRRARGADQWDYAKLEQLCRGASAVFRKAPWLLTGEVDVRARRQWSRLRDSDGAQVDFARDTVEVELEAVAISSDGLQLSALRRFDVAAPDQLPDERLIHAQASDMIASLSALQQAASTSPFNAPALIDPSVSAAVVLSIGLRLSGEELRNPSGSQTFRGKIGKAVLPPQFSLIDDPAQTAFQGKPLLGHYDYDDQGVAPERVVLVDRGVLEGLLLSRYPVIGFTRSNGHGRAFAGYYPEGAPGSLFLQSSSPLGQKELLSRLRVECRKRGKRYGLWIRRLRTFAQQQGTAGQGSIRLMPEVVELVDARTGALTLVRDLDLVGTPLVLLSNIVAAGDDGALQNLVYGIPMSVVTPSLLLSDVELQRSEAKPERPPILPAPQPEEAGPQDRHIPFLPRR